MIVVFIFAQRFFSFQLEFELSSYLLGPDTFGLGFPWEEAAVLDSDSARGKPSDPGI